MCIRDRYIAVSEWITRISCSTSTWRQMINYLTICILPTSSWTWILTFIPHTCSVWWTVRIYNTFRPTTLIRVANILWQASTWTSTILLSANSICSTWWWRTWSLLRKWFSCNDLKIKIIINLFMTFQTRNRNVS